ncbi:DUF6252 family protein [Hyunsoonleella ulvae]|uniref:DUF6252 family protein n=1 Tax=Hyunsoonleella ulvae TaxID=2799948 RepID=UPI001939948E|nr:DUF6252 family protein [Hyunsoonleella ulvae]
MKRLLLLLLVMALNACNNDDDTPTNPIDQLPPATQTGANTIGCLVNGEVLLPKGSPLAGPVKSAFYQLIDGECFFGLSLNNRNGERKKSIRVFVSRIKLIKNQIVTIDKNFTDDGEYTGGGGEYGVSTSVLEGTIGYVTASTVTGELTITHLDESKQIISGTFWFDAVNNDGEIVEIREGRFDMPYSK